MQGNISSSVLFNEFTSEKLKNKFSNLVCSQRVIITIVINNEIFIINNDIDLVKI